MVNIILAEDDEGIALPLSRALSREGYNVEIATSGTEAIHLAQQERHRLLILDVGLPEIDGLEVCRILREKKVDISILMLTARADEVDYVVGLDAGADDYVSKPFRLAELLARARALLRRVILPEESVMIAGINLDFKGRRLEVDGEKIPLSNKEFELLRFLLEKHDQLVTREEILNRVWGSTDLIGSKTLDMHISWLRRKIGEDSTHRKIVTVRGIGFRFTTN